MSNKTQEEQDHEREQLIGSLVMEDFTKLSGTQMQMVQNAQLQRMNEHAKKKIDVILDDEIKAIGAALTEAPYTYTSKEIKVLAGCTVKFSTLMTAQLRDAHAQLDDFIENENPNNVRMTDFLNRVLVAHALVEFNGKATAGVSLDPEDFQNLRKTDKEASQKILDEVREKRLDFLDGLSPHIVQRLIEYYQAFQLTIESMTKGEDIDEALGN